MLYQSNNSLHADLCKIEENSDFSFPKHMHQSFEFITVSEGEMSVEVDGAEYILRTGEALLIFPHQVHSLTTRSHSRHFLCIFSTKLVQGYSAVYSQSVPVCNSFTPSPRVLSSMLGLASGNHGLLSLKGTLYTLCAEFDARAEYKERAEGCDGLLEQIFSFVETEYSGDCSLGALAARTSYHYVYLSRYFKKCTGISFTEYVIHYRINEASYLLKNSDQSVLRTAYDCGFDSLRSFNRNFKRITGKTPVEYREARV